MGDKKDDRKAVWEYAVRSVFHAFDGTCQVSLEEQYQTFLAKGEPKVAKIPVPGRKVTITVDFITMVQKVDGASLSRMVRRREVAIGHFPVLVESSRTLAFVPKRQCDFSAA